MIGLVLPIIFRLSALLGSHLDFRKGAQMGQSLFSPGRPFRSPTSFSLSMAPSRFSGSEFRVWGRRGGFFCGQGVFLVVSENFFVVSSDKLKFVGHRRVSFQFLIGIKLWRFSELCPDEIHRFGVAAAAMIFVGDKIGEARIDARENAHALLGPIESLIVFAGLSIDF